MICKIEEMPVFEVQVFFPGGEVDRYYIGKLSDLEELENVIRDRCNIETFDCRIIGRKAAEITIPIE